MGCTDVVSAVTLMFRYRVTQFWPPSSHERQPGSNAAGKCFHQKNSKRLLKQWTLYATLKVKVLQLVRRAFLKIFQTIFHDLHSQQDDCDPQKKILGNGSWRIFRIYPKSGESEPVKTKYFGRNTSVNGRLLGHLWRPLSAISFGGTLEKGQRFPERNNARVKRH